jgi:tripartite-type tricarboxylate transporter receptor subunit TctC
MKIVPLLAALQLIVGLADVQAQANYPVRPIRTIIPIPAGAGVDVVMRRASEELLPRLGQPFVVDNQPGANFILGAASCAKAPPDGYTMCVLTGDNVTMNSFVFAKLPYDPVTDFKPVTNLFHLASGLFIRSSLPAKTLDEARALAASTHGGLNYGTLGPRTSTDITRMWIAEHWKVNLVGIPYKGGNLIIPAIASGEIDITRIGAYNALGLMKAGKVRLLGINGSRRFPSIPDVPLFPEVGMGDMPGGGWWGIFMPAAAPDVAVRRINSEIVRLFQQPKFAAWLEEQLVEIATSSPEEFAAFVAKDRERTGRLARQYGITPE